MNIAFISACIGRKYADNIIALEKSIFNIYPCSNFIFFSDWNFSVPQAFNDCRSRTYIVPVHYVPNPLPALLRYHYIMSIREQLYRYDYIYWIDADSEIAAAFGPEAFNDVVVVRHPWYDLGGGTFETNPKSKAYCDKIDGTISYVQGNFQGGRTETYLTLCQVLRDNTETDLMNRIIPVWYDESHLNWYAQNHRVMRLHPGYAYPSNMLIPYPKIILHKNAHDPVEGFDS